MHSKTRRRDAENAILELAGRQYGVISRAQLLAAGLSHDQVDRRLSGHRIHLLQRGVYRVGPLEVPLTRPMCAVLACGESAVVSHWTAAAIWPIMKIDDPNVHEAKSSDGTAGVDMIIPPGKRRWRPGVRVHCLALRDDETTHFEAIPVTTPTRTLYDLAGRLAARDLERAVAEAISRSLTSKESLEAIVRRYSHRPGANRLGAILGSGDPALTRSEAEELLLALTVKAQLPRPAVNVRVHGHEVDFYWKTERLIAEVDGFAFHASRRSFEADRRRDAILAAAGLRVMRVTWRQLVHEPEVVLTRLAQALALAPARSV